MVRATPIAKRSRRAPPRAAPEPRLRLETEERRAQLIALGREHCGARAYDDVSIDAIAAAAGISKGLLYHYFPTKRAYYAATIREAAALVVACTETDESMPPLARLHAGLDGYLTYVRDHAKAYATLLRSGIGVDPEIARIVDETRATFIARLTAGFEPGLLLRSATAALALRGWIGFAEAVSLGWTEAIAAGSPAPSQEQVSALLASALLQIVRSTAT
ncbi:TetR/AcrR family transcriptional regulator [soil metagenome]